MMNKINIVKKATKAIAGVGVGFLGLVIESKLSKLIDDEIDEFFDMFNKTEESTEEESENEGE